MMMSLGATTWGVTILQKVETGDRAAVTDVPRARGAAMLSAKARDGLSVLDGFRTSGCYRVLFPNRGPRLEAILINTSGGLTGGDTLALEARVGVGAHLALTTQAAERAYRSADDVARVSADITVEAGGHLAWLPQELILYDGAALSRSLKVDLAPTATLLMVEPVIFGRAAMGERLSSARFTDRIDISRDGAPLYRDGLKLSGDVAQQMSRVATGQGAGAMASVLYVAPDAEAQCDAVRAALPETGGASLLADDVLAIRCVAPGAFDLRRHLLPILDRLSRDTLPASWRL